MLFLAWLACADIDKNNTVEDTSSDSDSHTGNNGTSESQRYVITTSILIQRSGFISIFDREMEEEVWRFENTSAPAWPEARISPDGLTIWHNVVDAVYGTPEESRLVQRDRNGDIQHQILVDAAHHSFDFVGEETFATLVTTIKQVPEYGAVAGDNLTLVDLDGNKQILISSFDVLDPEPLTDMWYGGNLENAIDWTHSNAITWYPEMELYLMCLPGINAIWFIDSEGQLTKVLLGLGMTAEPYLNGPLYSEEPFEILTGGTFSLPHGPTIDAQGRLWVMSNGLGNETPSFAEGYDISGDSLELITRFGTDPSDAHSPGLGSVVFIEEDNTVVINWGIWGVVEERSFEDVPIWRQDAPLGEVYGFSTTAGNLDSFLGAD